MKTNVIMESEKSRNLFGVVIRQNTDKSMLSLTDLQEAYTHARVLNGWSEKNITMILNAETNIERIYYVLFEQGIIKLNFLSFMENIKNESLVKFLKEIGVYKTSGKGANKTVYCSPYIWVLVAMELNPMIYAKVITWLTDKLIINRIEACDLNNRLRRALHDNIVNPDYAEINRNLNIKIFGHHETGMRNLASESELKKLNTLQENIAFCVERGFLKTNEEIIKEIKGDKK